MRVAIAVSRLYHGQQDGANQQAIQMIADSAECNVQCVAIGKGRFDPEEFAVAHGISDRDQLTRHQPTHPQGYA
jgi:hypothetical protein